MKSLRPITLFLIAMTAATAAAATPVYSVVDLGTLPGNYSLARGLNESGTVVGQSLPQFSGPSHAVVFSNGGLQDLGTLGGTTSFAFSINDAGTITGSAKITGDTAQGKRI